MLYRFRYFTHFDGLEVLSQSEGAAFAAPFMYAPKVRSFGAFPKPLHFCPANKRLKLLVHPLLQERLVKPVPAVQFVHTRRPKFCGGVADLAQRRDFFRLCYLQIGQHAGRSEQAAGKDVGNLLYGIVRGRRLPVD